MEFFRIIDIKSTEQELKGKLSLQNLEDFCLSSFPLNNGTEVCKIGGMWGEFTLRRDEIMGGVRFSMLDCPNAFAWTITTGYPPARDGLVIHLTINRTRKQEEFVEEINQFLNDLENGLNAFI
ncbi:MAG: hypothetical protein QNK30_12925 [Bacteroidales bacterium]|nr:hypothetical protein [Bacteroidales bacterium]